MTDEKYLFVSDVRQKKNVARSARSKRTHNGKGGSVKFPSDFMTRKEIQNMNGEVKTYKLNDPMTWNEFMVLPDDIKIAYIKLIRLKFNAPGKYIAEMLGTNTCYFSKEINRLGISEGKRNIHMPWDKDGFYSWMKKEDSNSEDAVAEEADVCTEETDVCAEDSTICESANAPGNDSKESTMNIPVTGAMVFYGAAESSLKTLSALLGCANVRISVRWELCDNG